jgi:uncharacterized protein (DUF2147 family)
VKLAIATFLLVCLAAHTGGAAGPDPRAWLTGHWLAASGNVEVEIAACEPPLDASRLCGKITRVLANTSMSGSGQTMSERNDVGLQILSDFAAAGGDSFQGRILNRENGKVYDCILRPGAEGEMVVRPYVLVSLFGKTQTWHGQP